MLTMVRTEANAVSKVACGPAPNVKSMGLGEL